MKIAVLPGDYMVNFHDNTGAYLDGCHGAGILGITIYEMATGAPALGETEHWFSL